jgi:hypothetical protein
MTRPETGEPPDLSAPAVTHEGIARRAYDLYVSHGARDGSDRDDWFEAEQALNREAEAAAKGRA